MEQLGVLVVDENEMTRADMCASLTQEGFQVEDLDDGDRAKQRISHPGYTPIGVALVDLNMSCINGYVFGQWVRQNAPHVRVVFLSGKAPDVAPHAPQAVVQGYRVISKTVADQKAFRDMVWTELHRAEQAYQANRLISKFDRFEETRQEHVREEAQQRSEMLRALRNCADAAHEASEAAKTATNVAKTALDKVTAVETEVAGMTPNTIAKRWWDKADPVLKWGIMKGFAVITFVGTVAFSLIMYVASDLWDKVQTVVVLEKTMPRPQAAPSPKK